jgi:hypothetical protein
MVTIRPIDSPWIMGYFEVIFDVPEKSAPGNLATASALGQVSESAATWQIFRKIEHAAGMAQDILSTAREQAEQSDPQAL